MCLLFWRPLLLFTLIYREEFPNVYEQRRERCNGSLMIKNLAYFFSLTGVYRVLGFVEEFFSIWFILETRRTCFTPLCSLLYILIYFCFQPLVIHSFIEGYFIYKRKKATYKFWILWCEIVPQLYDRYINSLYYNGGQKSLERLWKTFLPHP